VAPHVCAPAFTDIVLCPARESAKGNSVVSPEELLLV
jgi:hypothetical protein